MHTTGRIIVLVVVGALMFASMSCVTVSFNPAEVGELQQKTEVVELGDVDEVRVDVKMGAGKLSIQSGAEDALMEASFAYNVTDWEPEVEYEDARLVIRQPNAQDIPFGDDVQYDWDLVLNERVPMDLRVDFGAGECDLELGDLAITNLDMTLGAGDIRLDLEDNETLERLEFDMGAGDVFIDLRGNWEDDVDVSVQGGVGQTTIRVPEDIGVRVEVTKGLGGINADGFRKQGSTYTNDAYGESDATIYIIVQAGLGQINLILD